MEIFRILFDFQLGNYFSPAGLWLILALFIFNLLNYKKLNPYLFWGNILILLASLSGMSLWFEAYDAHDYHLVNYLLFIPATCLSFFMFMQKHHPALFRSLKLKIPLLLIVLLSALYGQAKVSARYADMYWQPEDYAAVLSREEINNLSYQHWDYAMHYQAIESIEPYLDSIGISEDELVYSLPDYSPSVSLYLMGRRGIPLFATNGTEVLCEFDFYRKLGIRYLVLNDTSMLKDEIISELLNKRVGQYQNVLVFDISDFYLPEKDRFKCDAEFIDPEAPLFIGGSDSVRFANPEIRSDKRAHGGQYSVCLNEKNPFGFTTRIPNLRNGQIISVSVWRYSKTESEAGICIAANDPQKLYVCSAEPTGVEQGGWQKLSADAILPPELDGQSLSVYVFNSKLEKEVFFDDIEIRILEGEAK